MLDNYLSIAIILISLLFGTLLFMLSVRPSEFDNIKVKNRKKAGKGCKFYYRVFKRFPVLNKVLTYIENKLTEYRGEISDQNKKIALKILLSLIFVDIITITVFMIFEHSVSIIVAFLVSLFFINRGIIDYVVTKVKTNILIGIVDFLDIYRSKYYEAGAMPDEALLMSVQSLNHAKYQELVIEIERIHEVISSPDAETLLIDYYQESKNNYLKLFAGLVHLTMENGDTKTKSGTAFSNGLSQLSSEIKDEVILRERLNFSLKSLNVIAIIPLFIMTPLKNWASTNFYPLEKFYGSELGFQTEIAVLFAIILTYVFLSKIQHFSSAEYKQNDLYDKLLKNQYIRKTTNVFTPAYSSSRYKDINRLRESALMVDSMEKIYLKKLTHAVIFLVIALLISLIAIDIKRDSILFSPTPPAGYLGGELNGEELEKAIVRSTKDRKVIKLLEQNVSKDKISKVIAEEYMVFSTEKVKVIKRILDKYEDYKNARIAFPQLLTMYVAMLFGFFCMNLIMRFRRRILRIDSLTEITKYQLIILVLMQSKHTEIEDLLVWMERFSLAHREALNRAIMNYDSGSEKALEELKKSSEDEEFRKIIDHMIGAEKSVSIKNAFSELESEKKYYEEKRRIVYNRIIDKKIGIGKIIGFIPIYSLILIYFMFPLVYVSVSEMHEYFKVLS